MDSPGTGWWARHGWTVALLLTAFGISFLIRTVFMAALIQQFGPLNLYGGGSDSFYHSRVMEYIILNHHNLGRDFLLNYPKGAVNPREPLFDWMNALLGILFAPLFGGNAVKAGAFFLDLGGPLWAALGVFPIYLIGREASSKRMGLIAAFLYPLLVANIDSSTFGYANYLAFYTFFILLTVYGYLRTVKAAGSRRWVDSYARPREIPKAIRAFVRTERTAVKWAVFTGVAFGTLALSWQGYSFAVAAIVVFLLFALIVERIRRVDSFGLYVTTWIIGLVGFPMAIPYYVPQGLFQGWFDLPLLVFFGALLVALPFVLLRDSPWVVSIPVLAAVGGAAVGALYFLDRAFFVNIVTGQGYFVKTLVYSTVAEAQAPSIDALILGYGVVTFFLAFVGLALYVYATARARFRRVQMLFLVFAIVSLYLPVTAAKFFFLGSAAFALLPAEALVRALDVGGYGALRRNVASLSDRRSQFAAFRRSIKVRHVLVLVVVVGVLLPNVWYSIDAGIPYNSKSQYNQQIYNSLPPPFRTSPSNATTFYLGAAGTQLDTPSQYDENGYDWLALQDQNLLPAQRPAFVSWWDYGFQAVAEGNHPTVADNFQNGIVPAGNFLLSQNESQAIAILATTLLAAEQQTSGNPYLPAALNAQLASDGVDLATLHNLMVNTSNDIRLVIAHPERYLAVDASHLDGANALYDTMAYFLATTLPLSGVVQVYSDIQAYTGWSIRYAMTDSRLFPFSGSNTGIFYAPADLTDRVIGPGGAPTAYYSITILGSNGNTYTASTLPAGVQAVQYNINYTPAFYNTMIYKTFIGYSGAQVGSNGIPGLSGSAAGDPIEPGWMLQHFQVAYKTAYYCPFANPSAHPGCYVAMNVPDAVAAAKKNNGTADTSPAQYFGGGETILEYYTGQPMTGTVQLPDGSPVTHARVTVFDSWGIPHMSTVTGRDGSYSVVLPPGADTVNVTTGPVDPRSQQGTTSLATLHVLVPGAYGFNLAAPTMVRPVVLSPASVQGFVYWNAGNNTSYVPRVDPIVPSATVTIWGQGLPLRRAPTDASGSFSLGDVPPGVYNVSITYQGGNYSARQAFCGAGALVNETTGLSPGSLSGRVLLKNGQGAAGATVTVANGAMVIASSVANATGSYSVGNLPPGNFTVRAAVASQRLSSPSEALTIGSAGQRLKANLTIGPIVTVAITVVAAGAVVPSFPVRFTPIFPQSPVAARSPTNGTPGTPGTPSGAPVTAATQNSSLFFTDANGQITAVLPIGNYSVYGLGLIGGAWYAGFSSAYVSETLGGAVNLAPLFLTAASRVTGTSPLPPGVTSAGPTQVTAYDAKGDQVSTFPNASGAFALWLPPGHYTLAAVEGATLAHGTLYASLTTVNVPASAPLTLPLSTGVRLSAIVGLPIVSGAGGFYPANQAVVQLSYGGATVTALSNVSGNVSLVVPATLPAGGSYCLSVTAYGFLPYEQCNLSPAALGGVTDIPLGIRPVPTTVTVVGLPSGTALSVNLTANSSTAQTATAKGGPTFSLSLHPGAYHVTAWAVSPTPPGFLFPTAAPDVIVPLGGAEANITLAIAHEVPSVGKLSLPANLANSSVTVHLSSPTLNLTVNGAQFEQKFFAAPGSYQAYALAGSAGGTFATLTSVTVNATGVVTPTLSLQALGIPVAGNLTRSGGAPLTATVPVTFTGPGGLTVRATAVDGRFSMTVPGNATYLPSVVTTQLVPTSWGPEYETFVVASGAACTVGLAPLICNVPLVGTPTLTNLSGTLRFGSFPTPVSGSVQLTGPLPLPNVTTVDAPSGTFSVALLPGNYSVYSTGGGPSDPLANLTTIFVPPTGPATVSLGLENAWTDLITIASPGGAPVTTTSLWVHSGSSSLTLPAPSVGTTFSIALPIGVYNLQANATGSPYGVPATATARASVALLSGNAATTLVLSYQFVRTVSFTVVGPTSATVANGGSATFAFVVRNTGNVPVTVDFLGTPSYWNITFLPKNATLGTSAVNSSIGGEVQINVPAGTAVAHPNINLEAVLAGPLGGVAGFAAPAPTIDLVPFVGLRAGPGAASNSVVGPFQATVPFYVQNTGNVPEGVLATVQDAPRLAGLGWSSQILNGRAVVTGAVIIATGSNLSMTVKLTAATGHALPPGFVTVLVHVTNLSQGLTASVVVPVPALLLNLNATSIVVTGPSLGSPPAYSEWLIPGLSFLPAIALVIGVLGYRWYRTRRWVRR